MIDFWSDAIEGEIRDDQGISLHNPDTDVFMKYTLAGAYDSNIALLLTVGENRLDTYQRMAETIRRTTHARPRPGHQPGVPLRPGELVYRPEHQRPADHALHRALPDRGGRAQAPRPTSIDLVYAYDC